MSLVGLLLELKPLLADPDANFERVAELLERHQNLAEYEVARFYAGRAFVEPVGKLLRSEDPRERLRGVRIVPLIFARGNAAQHLRRMVKDADNTVAGAARAAVKTLGLADVAPPDRRASAPRFASPTARGGWNPTGWIFGLFRSQYVFRRGATATRTPPKFDVPALKSRADVAKLVGVETGVLPALMRPGTGKGSGYVEFEIPKRTGGLRKISAPRVRLKGVQRAILREILAKLPVHPAAHGFIEERSTLTNATPHVGAAVVVHIDIEDFFPTVHYRRVLGFFLRHYDEKVATTLAGLTTHRAKLPDGTVVWPGALPQGAPTSPALANLVCRRLDARLDALARKTGATYTRYADDLTFSFRDPPARLGRFLWWVNAILQQEGFAENVKKRRIMRKGNRQRVTGLVVDQKPSIPREERRRFKAILSNCRRHGVASQARGKADFPAWLRGYAAYVRMVHPELGAKWQREVEEILSK
ncbi:reverse transcriptase family protein [Polyangium fumosum]|uniref:RNA-directed DNA polymerase n=1 Tax=Polyangium fumosum TaxID=889272 RepID=A0A4U1ILJ3_9BACT|nr:reverse transcriptase family protein [Polyangium fumosum]TKC94613.1 RNA-directed DNA polymerase [Polyangium fumosum]